MGMDFTPATILLVEDHVVTRRFLGENLAADGYTVLEAPTAHEADRLIASAFPDLAILDLGLPDGDGLELLARLRASERTAGGPDPDLPVLILTGRTGELDRLRGFRRGADDYVAKPFGYPEVLARVGALLRRAQRRPGDGRVRIGVLEIDPVLHAAWVRGEPVALSKKEFALLRALASDPERVFTREELLRMVWGFREDPRSTRTLDSHAFRLRRKLGRQGDRFVVNVWAVGLRLHDGDAA
jgi:DNA-binding response OmpR family regulator